MHERHEPDAQTSVFLQDGPSDTESEGIDGPFTLGASDQAYETESIGIVDSHDSNPAVLSATAGRPAAMQPIRVRNSQSSPRPPVQLQHPETGQTLCISQLDRTGLNLLSQFPIRRPKRAVEPVLYNRRRGRPRRN